MRNSLIFDKQAMHTYGGTVSASRSVMVVGGGTMGVGIAQSFATAGAAVRIIESSLTAAEAAWERLASRLDTASRQRVVVTEQWTPLPEARLAIEAVPEEMSLKK